MPNARIEPAMPPYGEGIAAALERVMPPGFEPLKLFRVMARSERVFERVFAGSLLDRGSITLAEREIVIDRTCARLGAEYEWGVHVAFFAERSGLGKAKTLATASASPEDPIWSQEERLLLQLVDSLCDSADIDDDLWAELAVCWREEQLLEMIALVGFYHTISFVAKAARVPLENFAARFPARQAMEAT